MIDRTGSAEQIIEGASCFERKPFSAHQCAGTARRDRVGDWTRKAMLLATFPAFAGLLSSHVFGRTS